MRVVTGNFRGLNLYSPENNDIRPTSQKVKEAIFSSIQFRIENCNFLDLFSGTGQMAIEALSRGANKVTIVENSRASMNIIKKNLALILNKCNNKDIKVVFCDAMSFVQQLPETRFDVIFMDPPYNSESISFFVEKSYNLLNENGILICEHDIKNILPSKLGEMTLSKEHRYGKTIVDIYEPNSFKGEFSSE